MSRIDDTIDARKEKRQALEAEGIKVHPYYFDKQIKIADCLAKIEFYDPEQPTANLGERQVQTAGRILAIRSHGKVVFADLADASGHIQLVLRAQDLGQVNFDLLSQIDVGDFLGVQGQVMKTKTQEVSILVEQFSFLGKALRPTPSSFNLFKDKEVRFRRRYVDLLINDQARRVMDARWLILREIRRYLQDEQQFIEVETPVLQEIYGGTNARPFTTHMNALDHDFYLRVAPELYLKRLIVAGYERIFEIARNFRNEGIDQSHQPEFTMLEWYEAYADYHKMMDIAEGLIHHLATKLYGQSQLKILDETIDVGQTWQRLTMYESLEHYAQIKVEQTSDQQLQVLLNKHQIKLIGDFSRGKAIFALFDKLIPGQLIQPTWITDYPKEVSPLAKLHRDDPQLVERFEGYICGKEIADGWSELVDPLEQRRRFEDEQRRMRAGDDEAHPLDEDFIEALEYGLPPLGGIGIGIDRLVMFLTNTWSIREVIAFPTLRPKNTATGKDSQTNAST